MKKRHVLYLATFDPTVSATGTTTRGKLFLKYFSEHYHTHLAHLLEPHLDGRNEALRSSLASCAEVEYSALGYFLYSPKLYAAARQVLETQPVDFIFADFEKAGWYAYLLQRKFGVPYVYNSHNVEYRRYLDFGRQSKLRYPLAPYMYFVERTACANALFTVAISEKDAQTFRGWIPEEKLLTLPCAFDEEKFNPFYEEDLAQPPVILMVGNYRNPGNREGAYLLRERIMPGVLEKHPDAIFRCVGKSFPADIRHPNLQTAGFVDDLMEEYRRATVVIVPIANGGGIKIKTIEGLACGKYVVTTPKGIEGIDPHGLENLQVVEIDEFAGCINSVLDNPVNKTQANWEKISRGYGSRRQLAELSARIEKEL